MASVNPKIGNPPTAIERQLQTLSITIEWLTQQNEALVQQNQVLEVRIEQLQQQRPKASNHQECGNHR